MGFGQFSLGGGLNRTKADMLDIFAAQGLDIDLATARKGGKNRLVFMLADGTRCYSLHETVIAKLSADGNVLTLNDGGWSTPTTRAAMSEALTNFGLKGFLWGNKGGSILNLYDANGEWERGNGFAFDRTISIDLRTRKPIGGGDDCPAIRASIEGEVNVIVEYRDGAVRSGADIEIKIPAKRLLVELYRIDALARSAHGRFKFRRYQGDSDTLDDMGIDVLGYEVYPGSGGRHIYIGCHGFKTADVRAAMRRIEAENPEATKLAKECYRKRVKAIRDAAKEALKAA